MRARFFVRLRRSIAAVVFAGVCSTAFAQLGGSAGAFTNMGYGAYGIGMGNAGVALAAGGAPALYNPAASAFADTRGAYVSYSALGLDRSYNVFVFTAPIPVYKKTGPDSGARVSTIGISVGVVNTGVGNIDGRDYDGEQTGILSVYQNFYYGSVAIRFKPQFSVGILAKFLDAKLYDNVKSGGVGVDVGGMYQVTDALSVAAVAQNLFAKYTWDSTPLYNEQGQTTTDAFPVFFHAGAAYKLRGTGATFVADVEQSTDNTTILRAGGEYAFNSSFAVRAGVDGYDAAHRLAEQMHPSFGLSVSQTFGAFTPSFDYAAVFEPVAGGLTHVLALAFQF